MERALGWQWFKPSWYKYKVYCFKNSVSTYTQTDTYKPTHTHTGTHRNTHTVANLCISWSNNLSITTLSLDCLGWTAKGIYYTRCHQWRHIEILWSLQLSFPTFLNPGHIRNKCHFATLRNAIITHSIETIRKRYFGASQYAFPCQLLNSDSLCGR